MATIHPADPSYKGVAWASLLAALQYFQPKYFYSGHIRHIAVTVIFPALAFFVLAHRCITFQRACALRLTLTKVEFESALKYRPIVSSGAVHLCITGTALLSWITNFAHFTSIDNQPVSIHLSLQGVVGIRSLLEKIGLLLLLALPVGSFYCVMYDKSPSMSFEINGEPKAVHDNEVPLKVLFDQHGPEDVSFQGWIKVARVSRSQFIWVQRVDCTTGATEQVFDLKTTLAPEHHFYKLDQDGLPSGAILRVRAES